MEPSLATGSAEARESPAVDIVEAGIAAALTRNNRKPLVVGICGAQGSGKTTLCKQLQERFQTAGRSVAVLSIDDLYLPAVERQKLSQTVHPLLRTRGVPGTHDVALGIDVLNALGGNEPVRMPRFDKAIDDRVPVMFWHSLDAPVDLVLFEGWCVGARAQPLDALRAPTNELEATEDADARWRWYVNVALAGEYQKLFGRIDYLVLLASPGFEVVQKWRTQQEHELRELVTRTGAAATGVMSDTEIARFIQHYERLTRHILAEMPSRADLVVHLAEDRRVVANS